MPRTFKTHRVVIGVLLLASGLLGPAAGQAQQAPPPQLPAPVPSEAGLTSALLGLPRPWQAGMQVAPFSVVNLSVGNLITVVPLIAWEGVGPPIDFRLYHNSLYDGTDGWTHSYTSKLLFEGDLTVVHDDGGMDTYILDNGEYQAPPGVHDTLTFNQTGGVYERRTSRQWVWRYDPVDGRLLSITDAAGSALTIEYVSAGNPGAGKLKQIIDASGRTLSLIYDSQDRLTRVRDDSEYGNWTCEGSPCRCWFLNYSTDGLSEIQDPLGFTLRMAYEDGHVSALQDRDCNTRCFEYDAIGRVTLVSDPDPHVVQTPAKTCGNPPACASSSAVQAFDYELVAGPPAKHFVTYFDRAGRPWEFLSKANFWRLTKITDTLGLRRHFDHDSDLNIVLYTDELGSTIGDPGHTWNQTYDTDGNLLTATDPLGHTWTLTYDGYNNLTSVTPPADDQGNGDDDKRIDLSYTDATDPTALTSIVEPADGQGSGSVQTTLSYYNGDGAEEACPQNPAAWRGLLKSVQDPNGVTTTYTYDCHGRVSEEVEGPPDEPQYNGLFRLRHWAEYDSAGRAIHGGAGSSQGPRAIDWQNEYDILDYMTKTDCEDYGARAASGRTLPWPCPLPNVRAMRAGCAAVTWSGMRQPLSSLTCVVDDTTGESDVRQREQHFNEFGFRVFSSLATHEPTWPDNPFVETHRDLTYDPDLVYGQFDRVGPDGQTTHVVLDDRNLPYSVQREGVSAGFHHYYDGALESITYANDTRVRYEYDNARRLTAIVHERLCGGQLAEMLRLDYTWTPDGLIAQIAETDYGDDCNAQPVSATTTFTYDNRNRLVAEARVLFTDPPTVAYDLQYAYDAGGNRVWKARGLEDGLELTTYTYDIQNPVGEPNSFLTYANRLMEYTVYFNEEPRETVEYEYNDLGDVTRVIRHDLAADTFAGTQLYYDTARHLWLVMEQAWEADGQGGATNCRNVRCVEFRYDTDRARYVQRTRSFEMDENQNLVLTPNDDAVWTDYDGDWPYGDYFVTRGTGEVTQLRDYMPGLWQFSRTYSPPVHEPVYDHADQIGSARMLTNSDSAGAAIAGRLVYTAFGEPVDASVSPYAATRYQYAGAWGYESGLLADEPPAPAPSSGWLHVGARWYDPATGRFVQRDGSALASTLDRYPYVGGDPARFVDPPGTDRYVVTGGEEHIGAHQGIAVDDGKGGYFRLDFSAESHTHGGDSSGGWGALAGKDGHVTFSHPKAIGGNVQRIKSTTAEDTELLGWMAHQLERPPRYSLFYTCRDFAQEGGQAGLPHRHLLPGNCFVAGTVVETENGPRPIEEISSPDCILSGEPLAGGTGFVEVVGVHRAAARRLVVIQFAGQVLLCTPAHPFWVCGRGWVWASELTDVDELQDARGGPLPIQRMSIIELTSPVPVWNLTVSGQHTFFVGAPQALVHNKIP